MNKHVLVVSECVLNVTMVKHNICSVVLSISTRSKDHGIRDTDPGRDSFDYGVIEDLRGGLEGPIANLQIANVLVLEPSAYQSRLSAS